MSTEMTLEERKALVLVKLREYKLVERKEQKGVIVFLAETPKEGRKVLIWCLRTRETVGVRYVKQLRKAMEAAGVERGILISSSPYSFTSKTQSRKYGIELIPRIFPSFDIFEHALVPKHEVLTQKEKDEVLATYRVQPHQLPWIKVSDPAVRAVGGTPGDIVRIVRESPTAGKHISYRYIIEG